MLNKLDVREDGYYINSKKAFSSNSSLSQEDIKASFDFAYDMTFGKVGAHRAYRSGGRQVRRNGQIFIDAFQGKLAEFAFYNLIKDKYPGVSAPDLSTMGLEEWDSYDFVINDKKIAIKSTKHFGQLLLLETKDWNDNGDYIPNLESGNARYDYFVLVRIKPEGVGIMKHHRWLYSDEVSKDDLQNAIMGEDWKTEVTGYVDHSEIETIINDGFVLPQGAMLNGGTSMDAENYYVQAGDMHDISGLNI